MTSHLIPLLIIGKIDRKMRAFFWAEEDTCLGSQCLVAWTKACTQKIKGGLGIKT
jgi:hypothetical protein